jgi:hypothetical protein
MRCAKTLGWQGFWKTKQTLPVCRGFSQSLARKRMVRLEERDRCGADRHKKSVNWGLRFPSSIVSFFLMLHWTITTILCHHRLLEIPRSTRPFVLTVPGLPPLVCGWSIRSQTLTSSACASLRRVDKRGSTVPASNRTNDTAWIPAITPKVRNDRPRFSRNLRSCCMTEWQYNYLHIFHYSHRGIVPHSVKGFTVSITTFVSTPFITRR